MIITPVVLNEDTSDNSIQRVQCRVNKQYSCRERVGWIASRLTEVETMEGGELARG